jgi:thiosulfate/3-mercaptopyruvate sulfurtransferase
MPTLRHETLIDADALYRLLSGHAPVLLDCRQDLTDPDAGRRAFTAAHLPGARHVDLAADLSGPVTDGSGRHPLPQPQVLAARLGAFGITADTQVICYDAGDGSFAARAWWLLRWLGHGAVAVLDGGFAAWTAAGLPTVGGDAPPVPAETPALPIRPPLVHAVAVDEVARRLGGGQQLLVDARTAARYRGEHEPIDPVAGHIPGAVNRPFGDNLADGRFKPGDLLATQWQALLGRHAVDELVVYCGSGVTACHHLLALAHAGMPGARLYAGSWSEWCRSPGRPVARGD